MKTLLLLALCLMISACATGMNLSPTYSYVKIVAANLTGEDITNLKIEVGPGGKVLKCAEVKNNELCQERINPLVYPQEVVQISYQTADGMQKSTQVDPQFGANLTPDAPLDLMLDIQADGSVDASFKTDGF